MYTETKKSWISEILEMAGFILLIIVIRTFLIGFYQVPTGSMETTLLVGERFVAEKLTPFFKGPKRGDIIAFNDPQFLYSPNKAVELYQQYFGLPYAGLDEPQQGINILGRVFNGVFKVLRWLGIPEGPTNWTKRVIAEPGEEIYGTVENGVPVIYINGKKLEEPYLNQYPLVYLKTDGDDPFGRNKIPVTYDPSKPFNDQPIYNIDESRLVRQGGAIIMVKPHTPIRSLTPEDEHKVRLSEKLGVGYHTGTDYFHYKLGKDQYWVMGDNRLGSGDSRFFGPLQGKYIHAQLIWRLFSMQPRHDWILIDLIKHPIDFWKRVRWSRSMQRIGTEQATLA